jgi:lipid-binding SYLF domain-containing protein
MKVKRIISLLTALCLILMVGASLPAADGARDDIKDEAEQSRKAARVFREIMDTPDKEIPSGILDKAECVAVFPEVLKAGFIRSQARRADSLLLAQQGAFRRTRIERRSDRAG